MTVQENKPAIGGSKLESHFAHFQKWVDGLLPGPLVVEVAATHGCNHDCIHCGFQQFSRFSNEISFLPSIPFKRFIDDFADMGGDEIYFAGNGEPLLNENIDEWMHYIHGKNVGCALSSNGQLLSAERIKRILPVTRWIRFSVNGGNPATYAAVHRCRPEDFHTLTQNLAQAVAWRNQHNLAVQLVIQSLIYEVNRQSVMDLVAAHCAIGTDLLILRNVTFKGEHDPTPSEEIIQTLKEAEKFPRVKVRWETYGVNASENDWTHCYGINFRTNMDHLGNLFACFCPDSIYGNIQEQSFREIWRSDQKKKLFELIESGQYIPTCKRWCPTGYDNVFIEKYLKGNNHEQ